MKPVTDNFVCCALHFIHERILTVGVTTMNASPAHVCQVIKEFSIIFICQCVNRISKVKVVWILCARSNVLIPPCMGMHREARIRPVSSVFATLQKSPAVLRPWHAPQTRLD